MKESCIVEKIMWGNTDNVWTPTREYVFKSYDDAKEFLNEEKECQFSYMHKYNLNHTIEDWVG